MAKKNKKKPKSKLWSQIKMLAHMKEQYGFQTNWATATVYMTAREVEECFGKRCEDYEPLCVCCQAWNQWNQTGTVSVTLERDEIIKLLEIKLK